MTALSTPSVYRADTRLLVQATGSSISGLSPFETLPIQWLFFETQQDLLTSRAIAEDVVRRLRLHEPSVQSPATTPVPPPGILREKLNSVREFLGSWRRFVPDEFKTPPAPPPSDADRMASAVERVRGGVIVEGGRQSEVVVVGYQSTDPVEAALIVNTLAQAYIDFGLRSRRTNAEQTGGWLQGRLGELRSKLAASEDALRDYQSREGLADSVNRDAVIRARIDSLTKAQINAATARSQAQARYRELKAARDGLGRNSGSDGTLLPLLDNALVAEIGSKKLRLESRVSELSDRYGEKHPKMIAARAELAELTRTLSVQVNKALSAIRNEAEVAKAQEERLGVLIKESEKAVRDASGKAFRLSQLEREVESNRKLYETFLDRFKQADIAEENELSNIRIIDPARPPAAPFKPNRQRIVLLSALGGVLLGIALALLRDHLDGTLKDRDEVEQLLALPVLGVVPLLRGRAARNAERYLEVEPRSQFGEAINDVRTGIMLSDVDHPPKVILITSATADEGKTALAANLAASLARRGTTLLVEADLRRGDSARIFGLEKSVGLADYCSGDCSLEEVVVVPPGQTGLHLLAKGCPVPNPLEVLSSQRFKDALQKLRQEFEHIVIDCPPLLPVSDSIVLAREADSVVFVVRAGKTTADMAVDALKRIHSARVEPIGVVLQHCDVKRSRSYAYGYGSYYQYGNGG